MKTPLLDGIRKAAGLHPHQQRAIDKLDNVDRLLLYHGLGSGKTLTSIAAAENLGLPMTVVAPASVKPHFARERKKHGLNARIKAHSYAKPPSRAPGLLVFDEAHRMGRMESKRSRYPDSIQGRKMLMMTGTPIRNEPAELIPLLRGLGVDIPRDKQKFDKQFVENIKVNPNILARIFKGIKPGNVRRAKNLDVLEEMVAGKVDYHAGNTEHFPSTEEERIEVGMTPLQEKAYKMALRGNAGLSYKIKHGLPPSKTESGRMNAFLTATRQIGNTPAPYMARGVTEEDEPKINKAVEEIAKRVKKDPNYRGVSYSRYLAGGLHPLRTRLEERKIPHALFTGQETPKQKEEALGAYNKGDLKQLLISSAGGEGLDLKGTKLLQVLEPHWNDPTIEQIIGRAVRHKSHSDLPEAERNVLIQRFIAKRRPRGLLRKTSPGGTDEYLEMLSSQKAKLVEEFLGTLRKAGGKTPLKTPLLDGIKKSATLCTPVEDLPNVGDKVLSVDMEDPKTVGDHIFTISFNSGRKAVGHYWDEETRVKNTGGSAEGGVEKKSGFFLLDGISKKAKKKHVRPLRGTGKTTGMFRRINNLQQGIHYGKKKVEEFPQRLSIYEGITKRANVERLKKRYAL